jgi:Na+/glutamate symporter
MGLGYFDSETAASSTFGSVVCLAGIIGTPLGGFLIDCYTAEGLKEDLSSKEYKDHDEKGDGYKAEAQELVDITSGVNFIQKRKERRANEIILRGVTMVITISTFFGALFLCSVYKVADRALFLFLVTLGCMLVFLCNPGVNIALMTAVPEENR